MQKQLRKVNLNKSSTSLCSIVQCFRPGPNIELFFLVYSIWGHCFYFCHPKLFPRHSFTFRLVVITIYNRNNNDLETLLGVFGRFQMATYREVWFSFVVTAMTIRSPFQRLFCFADVLHATSHCRRYMVFSICKSRFKKWPIPFQCNSF